MKPQTKKNSCTRMLQHFDCSFEFEALYAQNNKLMLQIEVVSCKQANFEWKIHELFWHVEEMLIYYSQLKRFLRLILLPFFTYILCMILSILMDFSQLHCVYYKYGAPAQRTHITCCEWNEWHYHQVRTMHSILGVLLNMTYLKIYSNTKYVLRLFTSVVQKWPEMVENVPFFDFLLNEKLASYKKRTLKHWIYCSNSFFSRFFFSCSAFSRWQCILPISVWYYYWRQWLTRRHRSFYMHHFHFNCSTIRLVLPLKSNK